MLARGDRSPRLPIGVATIKRPGASVFFHRGVSRQRVAADRNRGASRPFVWPSPVIALLASACVGPRGGPPPAPPAPPERPEERPNAPISQGLPQDVARHRVALLVPLSGNNAGLGRSLQNATQLAILDTNTDAIRIPAMIPPVPAGRWRRRSVRSPRATS